MSAPTAEEHDRLVCEVERFAVERGRPVVVFVCFPPDMGVPTPESVPSIVGATRRIEASTRLNVLIIEGHRAAGSHRGNLEILESMVLASERSHWIYFRTSAEEALIQFPPPDLGVDPRRVLSELIEHGICLH